MVMRTRAFRRHKAVSKMRRRLKEDRNIHYTNLTCACWTDPRTMARFKEQPQLCSCEGCGNPRHHWKGKDAITIQERRQLECPIE